MKKMFLALGLCIVLLAVGCGKQSEYTEPTHYKVTFTMRGHICSEQIVEAGYLPKAVRTNIPGLRFVQWYDEEGQPVNPFTKFVNEDVRYVAEAYPALSYHVPYLFLDADGYLRPDAVLTADEMAAAFEALSPEEAKAYFPGMPLGDQSVTKQMLHNVLTGFFPADTVSQALEKLPDGPVTRTGFAQGMHRILNKDVKETLSIDTSVPLAKDITRDREDAVILMEASMLHTPFTGKYGWSQVKLPVRYQPGFVFIDGKLCYVQQNYLLLKDDYVDSLYFDAQGYYTSGDPKLDEQVERILGQLRSQNPGADRAGLLRAAFDYCCHYTVHEKNALEQGKTGWEIEEALLMFLDEKGDSYNFAAAFWALARGLGYDAKAISGTRGIYHIPRGWVTIRIEDVDYFFDPEAQLDNPQKDLFMLTKDMLAQWNYKWD